MNRRGFRNRLSIIYDILVCCSRKALSISEISRKANLSTVYLYQFTGDLVQSGFLIKKCVDLDKHHNFYFTSGSGRDFIRRYNDLVAVDNPACPMIQKLGNLKSCVLL